MTPPQPTDTRALDALAHRQVMGRPVRTDRYGHHWTDESGALGALPVPRYSTDIAAAWLIVEKMFAANFNFLIIGGTHAGEVSFEAPTGARFCAPVPYKIDGERAAPFLRAICEAAIFATAEHPDLDGALRGITCRGCGNTGRNGVTGEACVCARGEVKVTKGAE